MTKISRKEVHHALVQRYEGSFIVMKHVGTLAYRLELLARLKIYLVFHVSYLKSFHEDHGDPARSESY